MEYLGVVETVSGEGRFVVKAESTPNVNDQIFNEKGTTIGIVKRIFGPVEGPYVTVSSQNGPVSGDLIGKKVFFRGESKHGKDKRRH